MKIKNLEEWLRQFPGDCDISGKILVKTSDEIFCSWEESYEEMIEKCKLKAK
jgi:hypothetical protein